MESRGLEYLERVRQGFLTEAGRFPHQIAVINADQPIEAIHAEVLLAARQILLTTNCIGSAANCHLHCHLNLRSDLLIVQIN